ncbi:MAG TPA: UDP-N-acetylmuramoyl-L-alanyl-D-glutamate--2,6-diaminopimelate ligase [Candidatus Dormibacteraeota bacterium]|nr:UDP-N-acetylmuramoyl-L-alanyl-D-glutamate--2,6-diaminopimelate ligase [Candidatus Dormibacteraeota bacterium]
MTFQHLLDGAEFLSQSGNPDVSGVEYDSRRVKAGSVFVAMQGETSDGNRFIDQAIRAGAIAIVTDSPAEKQREGVAWALVPHGRRALARLSANFYKRPAERIAVTGITGTNGKSTTAFLIEAILTAAGRKSALIGTIEYHVAGRVYPAPHTTPEALELARLFSEALGEGATDAVIEVSSHALAQQRVFGVPFDVAVFTNLTRDHLDYHKTMEEYFAAKRVLFEGCGTDAPRAVVTNLDDEYGVKLAEFSRKRSSVVLTYGWTRGDFHAEKADVTPRGTRFDMITPQEKLAIFSPLIGRVNVYNILAAAAACFARGCPADAIMRGVGALTHVPGRFQRVDCGQPFTVVIDYAHTDDALRNLTGLAREFVSRGGGGARVITLFGCGGDRDRAKRPLMGEAAGRGSDFAVLTSDNPRSEDPLAIINDALVGLQRTGAKYSVEVDRRKAIALAIGEARPGDIVLLAGKGHEKVQVTRDGSHPFDDVEVAREVLRGAGFECGAK